MSQPMTTKDEQGYRNPAYIYDEGNSGGGPDSRSSSSTSSRSSMKMIGSKLKQQGRTKWLLLAVLILVVIILVAGVTVAIYFARNSAENSSLRNNSSKDELSQTSTSGFTTYKSRPPTDRTPTSRFTTRLRPSTRLTTTQKPNTPKITTPLPTRPTTKPTTRPTTRQTTTKAPPKTTAATTTASPVPTTLPETQTTKAVTTTQVPAQTTTSRPITTTETSLPNTTLAEKVTTKTTGAPPHVTTDKVTMPGDLTTTTSGKTESTNLTVSMRNILYNPTDVTALTLRCDGRHQGKLETLTIRKQFKDGFEPIAVAVFNQETLVEVVKLHPNVSHVVDVTSDYVVLTLHLDPFRCVDLTNYTCALANEMETATAQAQVSIFMEDPVITVPHSIVEDTEVTMSCEAEVWGHDADIIWKFKPKFATKFLDFSVAPVNNVTRGNCSTIVNSTLTFNISLYEDDADFRCQVVQNYTYPYVIQSTYSDVTMKVVPKNYCEGKQESTLHPHPHGPCTLVVFCVDSGPLVFEIECEPDYCYDYVKTACVPKDTG